jgi:hypothetical protein
MRILIYILFFTSSFLCTTVSGQKKLLDNFENIEAWKIFKSDGVMTEISHTDGFSGKGIKFHYDFTKGSGYGGIQKNIPVELPENYQFTFWIKAESPNNNFEIKFLDSSGENVWWVNNRNFKFPDEWKKITIKKRHITFAWGPAANKELQRIDRIEFTIASFSGGKGYIIIDDLYFEELPPLTLNNQPPLISSSVGTHINFNLININDKNIRTKWLSIPSAEDSLLIDLQEYREIGGLTIDWDPENVPQQFEIFLSNDNSIWQKIYSVSSVKDKSYIRLPDTETRYLKIVLSGSPSSQFGINELEITNPGNSEDINRFFINIAKDYPKGYFPRYFYEEASYWTVVGVNSDVKEALLNEDGLIEVDKSGFSVEPMLFADKKLYTWNNVNKEQSLLNNYLPVPKVQWSTENLILDIETFAGGEANINSILYINYKIKNITSADQEGKLFLLLRPFQVNPYYQDLNMTGGVSGISTIAVSDNSLIVDNKRKIYSISPFHESGTMMFEEGNIVSLLSKGYIPVNKEINDQFNLGSGVLVYNFNLQPGEAISFPLAVPFYNISDNKIDIDDFNEQKKLVADYWEKKVSHVKFNLPLSAMDIINTYKSNLAYILINRDNAGIQPGSRSYERSWIRDGSLTSSALLKSGLKEEVREFIDWYSEYQYENGKIPCVVDSRGPDPVPENDSHGEYLFLLKQYFNFTKDTFVLTDHNSKIIKTVDYIRSLVAQRSTDHFRNGNDSVRAYYGIMPESISHEGYSAKPMHSYWDNFFTIRGLKDAADIQKILGEDTLYQNFAALRDTFSNNLYNSLKLAIKTRKIDFIPGSVELGDFDPTSTTIALYPVNEKPNLPQPYLSNTFNKYFDFFRDRRDGKREWLNYTPYEVRTIGSYIFLDEPDKAHTLITFFMNHRRPKGWNHWAEVVWNDLRKPSFIGDMPHTWVGSDFINAVRAMFVYENDYDSSIVIGAGLYQEWINSPEGISVENLPTYYGDLSYSIKNEGKEFTFRIYGSLKLPKGNIIIKNFNLSRLPSAVLLNGKQIKNYSANAIIIDQFPAEIKIMY